MWPCVIVLDSHSQQRGWHVGMSVLAAAPSSEVSAAGVDRRGRQKITWQPPTASQREDTAQVRRHHASSNSVEFIYLK